VLCAALSAHKFTLIFDFVVGVCRWHINPEMKGRDNSSPRRERMPSVPLALGFSRRQLTGLAPELRRKAK
jgi:hypothetical protein